MKILIVTGGKTGEREISFSSAKNIVSLLDEDYSITQYDLPRDDKIFNNTINEFDLVIPIIHGLGGENGYVSKICEDNNIPYLFSSSQSHLNCFDKNLCKDIVKDIIKTPKTYTMRDIDFPVIYKKIDAGSSLDISIIENKEQLSKTEIKDDFIFEEYISGREFTVSVIEIDNQVHALPVIEILKSTKIFNKEQKYADNNCEYEICPAEISIDLENELKNFSTKIFEKLDSKHIIRIDYIVTENNEIYFLEVNTIPGMTKVSLSIKSIEHSNHSFTELLKYWIKKESN